MSIVNPPGYIEPTPAPASAPAPTPAVVPTPPVVPPIDTTAFDALLAPLNTPAAPAPGRRAATVPQPAPLASGATFLAKSRKAVAGGLVAAVTAAAATIPNVAADGVITAAEWWVVTGAAVGGFFIGFAGVWVGPANAS